MAPDFGAIPTQLLRQPASYVAGALLLFIGRRLNTACKHRHEQVLKAIDHPSFWFEQSLVILAGVVMFLAIMALAIFLEQHHL